MRIASPCWLIALAACGGSAAPRPPVAAAPKATPVPTTTAAPNATPASGATPALRATPAPTPTATPAPSATPAPTPTATPAPSAAPAPKAMPRYRVAVMRLETPFGDVNAPEHAATVTELLQRAAAEKGILVRLPPEACYDDLRICAVTAGKRAGAGLVIYGTLVHGTEAGSADITLESIELPSGVVRSWEESVTDSDFFYEDAAWSAYAALVEAPPP